MTRVLIVHSSDELYGADRVLLMLVEHLDRGRFDVQVVVPDDLPYEGKLTAALSDIGVPSRTMGLAVLRRRHATPLGLIRYVYRLAVSTLALRRVIKRDGIDLVHSFTTAVLPGALAARLTGTPHVWSAHELILRPRILARVVAWLLPRLSATVVAVSEAMRDHLVAGSRRNSDAVVIPNAIDAVEVPPAQVAAVRGELGAPGSEVLVGTVGRLRPSKGQHVLIDAAASIGDESVRYAVIGSALPGEEAPATELEAQAGRLGIGDRFTFTGFRGDVPAIMAALDVFVSPSTHPESFGLGILEAMAAGTAVVASDIGASSELVTGGVTGLLVDPGDSASLAAAITDLARNPAKRTALGAAGRERAVGEFGVDRFAARWSNLYDGAAAGGRGRG